MEKIIIKLFVRDNKYFVSKYNDDVIDPELSSYIMNFMIGTDTSRPVEFIIDTKEDLTKEEENKYEQVIRNEFKENIDEIDNEMRKSDVKKVIISILGIVFISISYLIDATLGHILSQIFTVFGWVAIWEVAYGILFSDAKRKKMLKRYKQLYVSNISFK